jgi:hypothetical protein
VEGVSYGAVYPAWHTSTDNADPNNITYRAQNESPTGLTIWSDTSVTVSASDPTPGNVLTVTVTYTYTLLTPLVGRIAGGQTLPVSGRAMQTIISSGP